jgi:type I site-specific restriction endonuclease
VSAEQAARQTIDKLLARAGWAVQDCKQADIHVARGVAIREFVLNERHGFADYLLYVDGKAAGVIEAKKQGATLIGVEIQSARYPHYARSDVDKERLVQLVNMVSGIALGNPVDRGRTLWATTTSTCSCRSRALRARRAARSTRRSA